MKRDQRIAEAGEADNRSLTVRVCATCYNRRIPNRKDSMSSPAQMLEGLTLQSGWKVTQRIVRSPTATGGNFSHGYLVERNGQLGFLKAMDYSEAFRSPNTPQWLQAMTEGYLFEKAICDKCVRMDRIVQALDAGSVIITPGNYFTKVDYLIFERADRDVRAQLDLHASLDEAFIFKTLHHVSTGLRQLHRAKMAHQDLKPSNVLIYQGGESAKICDMGRAWGKEMNGPYDSLDIAGDTTYAPIERLYGVIPQDEQSRRFGCDFYHLGSLIVFLFTRVHMNALIIGNLSLEHRPFHWHGDFESVLPMILAAFESGLSDFMQAVNIPERARLRDAIEHFCHPDPRRRGHPKSSRSDRYSLERYVSMFDYLAHRAKLAAIRKI